MALIKGKDKTEIIEIEADMETCDLLNGEYDAQNQKCIVEIHPQKNIEKLKDVAGYFLKGVLGSFTPSKMVGMTLSPFPVLGDTLYEGYKKAKICSEILKEGRVSLHEKKIDDVRKNAKRYQAERCGREREYWAKLSCR